MTPTAVTLERPLSQIAIDDEIVRELTLRKEKLEESIT